MRGTGSIVLTALAVAVLGSACGSSSSKAMPLDPRALVDPDPVAALAELEFRPPEQVA